jgi:hypothetical protein
LFIKPAQYRCLKLAAELADKWLEIAAEIPGNVDGVAAAVRSFLRFLDRTKLVQAESSLVGLNRAVLDAWEADLVAEQRNRRTDTPYQRAVSLFALLRRINDDTPGLLAPDLVDRLQRETRLQHLRRPADPEFPAAERALILAAADRLVTAALNQARAGHPHAAASRDVMTALQIQLALATGEPVEVLRRLSLDDLHITVAASADGQAVPMTPDRTAAGYARLSAVRDLAVTYTKTRAAEIYQSVYRKRDRAALAPFLALIEITAQLRTESTPRSLWLVSTAGRVAEASWTDKSYTLRRWVERHVHNLGHHKAVISEPIVYRRFRKTVTAAEALQNPARYFRTRHRHTPQTFFDHYATSPVLRAEAGRILLEAVSEQFEAAVGGPVVITTKAEEMIAAGEHVPGLDPLTVKRLTSGELDTPVAACRDPLASPHAAPGVTCPVFANGQCYNCPNALITRRHLPAALAIIDRIHPDRTPDMELWIREWEPAYEFLTRVLLPAFSADEIASAHLSAPRVLLDGGLRNDLGAADEVS